VSEADPADEALATIASILDQPEARRGPDRSVAPEKPMSARDTSASEANSAAAVDAHGYSKTGPGPMDAIRFKWTVRRAEGGDYYVDETIGERSTPIISGPMTAEAAIRWVNDRENDARQRFDRLRSEMAARTDAAELIQLGGGEG
jgi:hypothetical protein